MKLTQKTFGIIFISSLFIMPILRNNFEDYFRPFDNMIYNNLFEVFMGGIFLVILIYLGMNVKDEKHS